MVMEVSLANSADCLLFQGDHAIVPVKSTAHFWMSRHTGDTRQERLPMPGDSAGATRPLLTSDCCGDYRCAGL